MLSLQQCRICSIIKMSVYFVREPKGGLYMYFENTNLENLTADQELIVSIMKNMV